MRVDRRCSSPEREKTGLPALLRTKMCLAAPQSKSSSSSSPSEPASSAPPAVTCTFPGSSTSAAGVAFSNATAAGCCSACASPAAAASSVPGGTPVSTATLAGCWPFATNILFLSSDVAPDSTTPFPVRAGNDSAPKASAESWSWCTVLSGFKSCDMLSVSLIGNSAEVRLSLAEAGSAAGLLVSFTQPWFSPTILSTSIPVAAHTRVGRAKRT
ncbi:unnamed protein product, partial [Ectocarpus sp. 12 AP-2014]